MPGFFLACPGRRVGRIEAFRPGRTPNSGVDLHHSGLRLGKTQNNLAGSWKKAAITIAVMAKFYAQNGEPKAQNA